MASLLEWQNLPNTLDLLVVSLNGTIFDQKRTRGDAVGILIHLDAPFPHPIYADPRLQKFCIRFDDSSN